MTSFQIVIGHKIGYRAYCDVATIVNIARMYKGASDMAGGLQ